MYYPIQNYKNKKKLIIDVPDVKIRNYFPPGKAATIVHEVKTKYNRKRAKEETRQLVQEELEKLVEMWEIKNGIAI